MMDNLLCKYVTGGLSQQHVDSNLCRYNRSGIVAGEHISELRLSLTDDQAALLPSQSTNIFDGTRGLHIALRIRKALLDLTK